MRSRNSHRNTLVTEQNRTSPKKNNCRSNNTGSSVITGGIAKEMQLLTVPVEHLQCVFACTSVFLEAVEGAVEAGTFLYRPVPLLVRIIISSLGCKAKL